ncbi:glutamate-gated chloride channel subunit beta-like [Penaeus vannamei]|uniref:glutamate-gated chloride channel subunit beta-like n=1 Tax=Penaeus vannamei TaxID=6689 RepID=UPI00387F4DA4
MTACGEGEYTCANGDCIEKSRLCDLTLDCADQSDELACDPVEVPRGYTAKLPPPSPTAGPLALRVVINITSIKEFSLVEFRIGIDVHYAVMWYDARLAYRNLKEDYRSNKIQKPSPTWRPEMHIRDSTGSVAETFLHHDAMYVERNSEPLPDDRRRSVENAVFSGSTNKLIYEREETLTIMCYYDLRMYPFDDQECSFTLSVQDMSDKFGRFVEIQLHFENQYKYYLVNAFAPSLMMVVICLLTLGFDLHDFQDRIMVSLTSLLVLAAFFTQTSQSIPKTSYVKFIDAWYLALICEDFLVIVALVCVEVVRLREEAAGSKLMHVAPFDKLRNNFVATSKAAKMNTFLITSKPWLSKGGCAIGEFCHSSSLNFNFNLLHLHYVSALLNFKTHFLCKFKILLMCFSVSIYHIAVSW